MYVPDTYVLILLHLDLKLSRLQGNDMTDGDILPWAFTHKVIPVTSHLELGQDGQARRWLTHHNSFQNWIFYL